MWWYVLFLAWVVLVLSGAMEKLDKVFNDLFGLSQREGTIMAWGVVLGMLVVWPTRNVSARRTL
jgi:hypothetical protein